jgi:hypothetical protein
MEETEGLRAEVAELRAEVERLKISQASHVCAPNPIYQQWYNTAGAAGYNPTVTWMPGEPPLTIYNNTAACAGGVGSTLNFLVPTTGAG